MQSVRFDRDESPEHVNEGKGWRQQDALNWLNEYGLFGDDLAVEKGYIRAKQYQGAGAPECKQVETGVMILQCERAS